ncbi:hypothetical protein Cni_G28988 [Canna indica]|uniref:GBF-interacting protein 1 N-terminal domain-containing protein n=1 Tax=Canna indica TaxID=4628 RepID=A0AAQ3L4G1_9LILI|nr:hypothetical protein Cni_G28988 [Canna indica]
MVLGSRTDGGSQVVPLRMRKTIQSIKEIVGDHSDADIYATLKETDMDPNETAQKLLYQDPFHEVKRKRDRKKESTVNRSSADIRRNVQSNVQWAKSRTPLDQIFRSKGHYMQNSVPKISKQFRVVRDNRGSQNNNKNDVRETLYTSTSSIKLDSSSMPEESHARDEDLSMSSNLDKYMLSAGSSKSSDGSNNAKDEGLSKAQAHSDGSNNVKEERSSGSQRSLSHEEAKVIVSSSRAQELHNSSQAHSKASSSNSAVGVYSSSSDPVHVPSADSRSAGVVGAIRREVGAVGAQRRSCEHRVSLPPVSTSSFSISLLGKDISPQTELSASATFRNNQLNQVSATIPALASTSMSRTILGSQQNSRLHQQSVGNQKAVQSNMEWKPKAIQKSNIVIPGAAGTDSGAPSCSENLISTKQVDVTGLSEKFSKVSTSENEHVIIPQHLQVPESERAHLTFGSFEVGFDLKGFSSANEQSQNAEDFSDGPSVSISASSPLDSTEDVFTSNHGDNVDVQARASLSDYPASAAESEEPPIGNNDSVNSQIIGSYADIGLVQSGTPYSSGQQLQNSQDYSSFSAYDNQSGYDAPFLRTVLEDNVRGQDLASSSEALNSLAASFSPSSTGITQQQQFVHQPQQSLPQMYPQVHIPHYPNFVPYRQMFSPVYGPPIAMPNYSSNGAYPHPSNGNNYLLLPGGSSQMANGNMKYAPAQYKPVPAGSPTAYASYNNSAFTISSPGAVGSTTGLEDFSRIKYKDNSLYVPNQQAEASDIWIQTPRDAPSMQSATYFNLPGQGPHAAFMPTHAGHASFSAAAQIPHVQYPGLYHPTQPASMATPHQLVHHQVSPTIGGGVGVGVAAAPGPQVGTYQQPQLGHLNWTANF